MGTVLSPIRKGDNNRDISAMLKSLDAECRNCFPMTPLQCINGCQVYKLKNELRNLRGTMNSPNYMTELFNVLKNETRLQILQAIANARCSLRQLQQELKKTGHSHSQENINEEYLRPLMSAGLANEARDEYYATTFGSRITEMLGCFPEFAEKLPPHSECHEEMLLQSLLSGPKTFEEVKALISAKTTSRMLKRLRSAKLIKTPRRRSYVFFCKSKRDPNLETFKDTQRRVYDAIVDEGISAGNLAEAVGFAVRTVYRCVRGLKGKKLVFTRRIPKVYSLTCEGEKLAAVLLEVQEIVEDTWNSSEIVVHDNVGRIKAGGLF